MGKGKEIDYLFEDPVIPSQQYALISIIGPHMPQKCSVWGLKIRGVAKTLEECRSMAERLHAVDDNYDIHSVEVGKFFPLVVDPAEIKETEYINKELNNLNKEYLRQNELANDEFLKRKNELVKKGIEEGINGVKKTAIVTYTCLKTIENRKESLLKEMDQLNEKYNGYKLEFEEFSLEEQEAAVAEFDQVPTMQL